MAAKLVRPPIPASQLVPSSFTKMMRADVRAISAIHSRNQKNTSRSIGDYPSGFRPIRVAEQSSGFIESTEEQETAEIKAGLYEALQGLHIHVNFQPQNSIFLHYLSRGGIWGLVLFF